jgi:hypothetical protein
MTKYSELLRDPRWQKRRLEVMNRDNFTCQHCGETTRTLNVHHCYYDRGKKPWEYPIASLVTLCCDCHEFESAIHGSLPQEQLSNPLLRQLLQMGLTVGELEVLSFKLTTWQQNNETRPTRDVMRIIISALESQYG